MNNNSPILVMILRFNIELPSDPRPTASEAHAVNFFAHVCLTVGARLNVRLQSRKNFNQQIGAGSNPEIGYATLPRTSNATRYEGCVLTRTPATVAILLTIQVVEDHQRWNRDTH